jgi:hypothetical protein
MDRRMWPRSRAAVLAGSEVRKLEYWGISSMESVQPDNADRIPLQHSQHSVGSIAIRFIGLLLASVVVMALIWSS